MAAAVEVGTPATAEPTPAPKAAEPKPEAKAKPEAKSTEPVDRRDAVIAKFAKRMNAEAEKDGIEVVAPPEERRAKPGPKPGTPRAPKAEKNESAAAPEPKAEAKAQPKATAEPAAKTETEEPEGAVDDAPDEDADTGKPEPRSTHQLKAKARLRHGDVDKAIKLAFGDMKPEEFEQVKENLARKLGVGSKDWADFRRFQKEERAKTKQFHDNATQLSQRLQSDFGPMIEARKAYAAGDYPKAFELAFNEEINAFQRKAIHQHLSADPEKTRLAQELNAMKAELAEIKQGRAKPEPAADPQAQHVAALNREAQRAHEQLVSSDDAELAHFAKQKAFIRRVVELRGEHYDPQTRTTIPLHVAADMARDEFNQRLAEWRVPDASGAAAPSSELPGLAGKEPVRTGAPRARSPLPSQAAQAGGSTRSLSREERIRAFAMRMG